jgi:hypothetical protein
MLLSLRKNQGGKSVHERQYPVSVASPDGDDVLGKSAEKLSALDAGIIAPGSPGREI